MRSISVIICTLNRAASLAVTLDSLAASIGQSRHIEAVIIDNGSTDNTHGVVMSWAKNKQFSIIYAQVSEKGLSKARNAALSLASGELLVFSDDDCHLHPDYFVELEKLYRDDEMPVMRGGRVLLGDPTDMPFTIKEDSTPEIMSDVHFPGGFIIGANMVIPREIVQRIGLFDERFGAGGELKSAEDTDYVHRVHRNGYKIEYRPEIVVSHFHGRKDISSILNLHRCYNIGNGALYAKYCIDWRLLRHFYWDFRKMLKGIPPDRHLPLKASSVITGNLLGICKFVTICIRSLIERNKIEVRQYLARPIRYDLVLQFGPALERA